MFQRPLQHLITPVLMVLCSPLAAAEDPPPAGPRPLGDTLRELREQPEAPVEVLVNAWLRTSRLKDSASNEEIAATIAALGGEITLPVLRMFEARRVPVPSAADFGKSAALEEQMLSVVQERILLDALAGLDAELVLDRLDKRLLRSPTLERRRASILVRGAVGGEASMERLLDLAHQGMEETLEPALEDALESAATELMLREPGALPRLALRWRGTSPLVQPAMIRAIGATRDARGVRLLADVITWSPELEQLCLCQLPLLGPAPDAEVNARLADALRPLLTSDELRRRQAAILALAAIGDYDSTETFIAMLDEQVGGTRANAHYALKKLSGLKLDADPILWKTWYERELVWFGAREQECLAMLKSSLDTQVASAIREIGLRRLDCNRLAAEIAPMLSHENCSVRRLTCQALQALRSPYAHEQLVGALRDSDEVVRRAAWKALVAITGMDLPAESEAWERFAPGIAN